MTVPVIIYTKKDFYLLDQLNDKIETLKAAGLIDFWFDQDIDKRLLTSKKTDGPMILTVDKLLGSFQILLAGCFISFIVFVIELSSRNSFLLKLCRSKALETGNASSLNNF